MLNPSIILAGQGLDASNALAQGYMRGQAVNDAQHTQGYRNALSQFGAGALNGDPEARNALARYDPAAMQGMAQTDLGMDATRLGMDATRQNMSIQQQRLQMALRDEQRAVQQHAASMSAAERAAAAAQIEQAVASGLAAPNAQAWDMMMGQSESTSHLVGMFDNREMVASGYMSIADSLARMDDLSAGPEMTGAMQTRHSALLAAGHQPGSPEYQRGMAELAGLVDGAPQVVVNNGQAVPEMGTIPQGFEVFTNAEGRREMRPILGGPEDRSSADAVAAAQQTQTDNIVTQEIDRAIAMIDGAGISPVTGLGAETAAGFGGTAAADMSALLDTIEGITAFETLAAMRAASPTGGALGAISERELSLLAAVKGSLSQTQSPAQLRENLQRLRDITNEIIHGQPAQQPATGGSGSWTAPATETSTLAAPQTVEDVAALSPQDVEALVSGGQISLADVPLDVLQALLARTE